MTYVISGVECATDDEGYLLEPNYDDDAVAVIAAAENIDLTPTHWLIVQYMREEYKEHGQTPNFRNMLKDIQDFMPEADSKFLYDLFPMGPAKQAAKIAGLPKPYGKGGY